MVVEASGAVSLAALEHLNLRSRTFAEAEGDHVGVPIMSGGNTDSVALGVAVETNGPEHIEQVLQLMREAGYTPKRIY